MEVFGHGVCHTQLKERSLDSDILHGQGRIIHIRAHNLFRKLLLEFGVLLLDVSL